MGGLQQKVLILKTLRLNSTSTNNVFIDAKPYESWTLNTSTWQWEAPVAYPSQNPPEIDGSSPPIFWDEPNFFVYVCNSVFLVIRYQGHSQFQRTITKQWQKMASK